MSDAKQGEENDRLSQKDPLAYMRILTMDQLCELTSYSKQHLYRMQRAGEFPKRRQIGPNRVGVTLADYEKWFASRPVVEPSDDELDD